MEEAWLIMSSIAYPLICAVVVALGFIVLAYARGWAWTGFAGSVTSNQSESTRSKTLWDWLQLLVVPLALAAAAFGLNELQSEREHRREDRRAIAEGLRASEHARAEVLRAIETRREAVLRGYLQQMAELLLDRQLRHSSRLSEVRVLARTLTLTTLRQLDGARKSHIVRFLSEAGLINGQDPTVDLRDADLRYLILPGATLHHVNFSASNLIGANFRRAWLTGARFRSADLRHADFTDSRVVPYTTRSVTGVTVRKSMFRYARLSRAQFNGASLWGADFSYADLRHASFRYADATDAIFTGACLTDATFYDTDILRARLDAYGSAVAFRWDRRTFASALRLRLPPTSMWDRRNIASNHRRLARAGWRYTRHTWRRSLRLVPALKCAR
jgi:uncharacterized protein YjbI with pentapeptide repeats